MLARHRKRLRKNMLLSEDCPIHCQPLVPTPHKSKLAGKCIWRSCYYGVLASDPTRQVQDVTEWNVVDDGKEDETAE
jgi:hypothetical protein